MSRAAREDHTRGLLNAGALLPTGTKVPVDEPIDEIGARTYRHPALGDRAVVRLVAHTLAPAEDLTLEFLGFGPPSAQDAVAVARRRSLGFPGWALVHDPQNAGYALAVVKEIERLARVAKSKPGNAKDGFDVLAGRLQRSVPRFLPSYFEQAGRVFVEAGNNGMASAMFGKARAAEQAHSLEVDEETRRAAFLEFAFAGALSAKSLDEYAKRLAEAYEAPAAYDHFRQLAVQRTLGGLPPWTGMVDGLRRLAKAAGFDTRAEDERLVVELLDAPATALAPLGFWKPLRAALVALAQGSPSVRGRLLNLFPKPGRDSGDLDVWWLELLRDAGAWAGLTDPPSSTPPEAAPTGGPASWLSRLTAHIGRGWRSTDWSPLLSLLDAMADRLRADGVPVVFVGVRAGQQPIDAIDRALGLGIPVAPPTAHLHINLDRWLSQPPDRREPLTHLSADPDFGAALDRSLFHHLWDKPAGPLLEFPGLRAAVVRWLDARAAALSSGGIPDVHEHLDRVVRAATPAVVALNQSAAERIRSVDVAAALGRTLRAGIFDELGWPALESIEPRAGKGEVNVHGAWPFAIVSDGARAFVVGHDAIALEHDFRLPPSNTRWGEPWFTFVDGQLLVTWRGPDGQKAYWSRRPGEVIEFHGAPMYYGWRGTWSLPVPSGGRSFGARPLRAGDSALVTGGRVVTDGTDWWTLQQRQDGSTRWHEFDPLTGTVGRVALPPWFETGEEDGWRLQSASCWLASGVDGAVAGQRVRERDDGSVEVAAASGETFRGRLGPPARDWRGGTTSTAPATLLVLGDGAPRPLTGGHDRRLRSLRLELWDPAGAFVSATAPVAARRPQYARGTPVVPPADLFHALRLRDPAGSAALRRLDDTAAGELLAAAAAESSEVRDRTAFDALRPENLARTRAALARLAPDVRADGLVEGVLGVVQAAAFLARLAADAAAVVSEAGAGVGAVEGEPDPTDQQISDAIAGLGGGRTYWGANSGTACLEQVRFLSAWMASSGGAAGTEAPRKGLRGRLRSATRAHRSTAEPAPSTTAPATAIDWTIYVGNIEALAYRAVLATTPADQRRTIVRVLETWARTVFADRRVHLRRLDTTAPAQTSTPRPFLQRAGPNCWFYGATVQAGYGNQTTRVLEHAQQGTFAPPPGYDVKSAEVVRIRWGRDEILRFLALLDERGPVAPTRTAIEGLAGATGLTRAESVLLAATLPNIDRYEQNFLDKATREAMGLKVAEAAAARNALARVDADVRLRAIAAAVPDDPTTIWAEPDAMVRRIADAWVAGAGRRVAIPDDLLVGVKHLTTRGVSAPDILGAIVEPPSQPALTNDAAWTITDQGMAAVVDDSERVFSTKWLLAAAPVVAWLAATLPVGDPVRARLPDAVDLLRARLAHPDLLVSWTVIPLDTAEQLQLDRLPAFRPPRGKSPAGTVDSGVLVFATQRWQIAVHFRPAALARHPQDSWVEAIAATAPPYGQCAVEAARFLLGSGAAEIAARVRTTPVPAGSFEADPRASVPAILADVAAVHGLGEDAATLYLQLLTLHDATTKAICTWNGWTATVFKRAAAELVAGQLIVAGKRPRAGRDLFLPGGWEPLKAPDLPIETWKLPLYELRRTDTGVLAPLRTVQALRPRHALFETAWARCRASDAPGLEAVGSRAGERRKR